MVFRNQEWKYSAWSRDRFERFAKDSCASENRFCTVIYMIGDDSRMEVLQTYTERFSGSFFSELDMHIPERVHEFRRVWDHQDPNNHGTDTFLGIRKFLAPRLRSDQKFAVKFESILSAYKKARAAGLCHEDKMTVCAWSWSVFNRINVYESMLALAAERNMVRSNLRDLLAVIVRRASFDDKTWLPVMYQSTEDLNNYVVDERFCDFTAFCLQIEYAGIKRPARWRSNISICEHSLIVDSTLQNSCKHVFCNHCLPKTSCIINFCCNLSLPPKDCHLCRGIHEAWKPLHYPRPPAGQICPIVHESGLSPKTYKNMVSVQYSAGSFAANLFPGDECNLLTSKLPISKFALPPAAHFLDVVMAWMSPNLKWGTNSSIKVTARAADTWLEAHMIDRANTNKESAVISRDKMLTDGRGRIPVCLRCIDDGSDDEVDDIVDDILHLNIHKTNVQDHEPAHRRPL